MDVVFLAILYLGDSSPGGPQCVWPIQITVGMNDPFDATEVVLNALKKCSSMFYIQLGSSDTISRQSCHRASCNISMLPTVGYFLMVNQKKKERK